MDDQEVEDFLNSIVKNQVNDIVTVRLRRNEAKYILTLLGSTSQDSFKQSLRESKSMNFYKDGFWDDVDDSHGDNVFDQFLKLLDAEKH